MRSLRDDIGSSSDVIGPSRDLSLISLHEDSSVSVQSVLTALDPQPASNFLLSDRGEELHLPRLDNPPPAPDALPVAKTVRPEYRDLWERIRAGFAMESLNSPLVDKHIQYYTHKPEYLERMLERGSRYLFYIVEEIERRGMPGELALLPFVESAMNPTAISPAKAAGLWQFIPSTGKAYKLSQNWWVDNRRDPVHSTQAALDYLQKIYELQGYDWFLALASYNWGEGAVSRAVRKNQTSGKPSDYLSLNMPQETRHYVPKLMALREIVANPSAYHVRLPSLPNKAYFVEVEAPLHLDLKLAARFAGMSEDEFVSLNPAHNRPVIAARANDQIKIPAERVEGFLEAMRAHEASNQPFSRWQPYTLAPGDSIQSLAARLGTSSQEIMRANGLRSSKVLPGTLLLAPAIKDSANPVPVMTSFEGPRILEKVHRPALYHKVGKRETTESIARRYGITEASLRTWNKLKQEVKQGMRLMVRPASAQTLLTNETGVAKVIETEIVPPKPSPSVAAAAPAKSPAPVTKSATSLQARQARNKPASRQKVQTGKSSVKSQDQGKSKTQPRVTASHQPLSAHGLL